MAQENISELAIAVLNLLFATPPKESKNEKETQRAEERLSNHPLSRRTGMTGRHQLEIPSTADTTKGTLVPA